MGRKLNTAVTGERTTVALTDEQFENLIHLIRNGTSEGGIRPNPGVAIALLLEGNIGIRVSDIVRLRLKDIVLDGENYRLNITEKKTGKRREKYIPKELVLYIQSYCIEHGIDRESRIVPITTRQVQRILKRAADYLGYERIGTHSFRKYFATNAYTESNYNLSLVQDLLQHSSAAVTQRYIHASSKELVETLDKITKII